MKISTRSFGSYSGQNIEQYILENTAGMIVKIATYGAMITSISLPDPDRGRIELVCGFDSLDAYFSPAYLKNAPYFGCTVGRYSSRIKDGTFHLNEQTYKLAVNDGSNHLHGGIKGFDKKVWEAERIEKAGEVGVKMSLRSPHMEEGYPGNLNVSVTFILNEDNELTISYEGETDQATPLSLTNHTYFNLSGFKQTIENHRATILADTYLIPDETNVPIGAVGQVSESPADLRSGKLLGEAFKELPTGFEHYFVFKKQEKALPKVAEFQDTNSGRRLEVFSTEPGMLFYTGYFTSDELQRENGDQYGRYRGFCCETHRYPNGPNIPNSPDSLSSPEKPFASTTRFKMSW